LGAYVENGVWKWVTGEDFNYTNWATNEPNGDKNSMVAQIFSPLYWINQYYLWDDTWNTGDKTGGVNSQGFICEWDDGVGITKVNTVTTSFGATVSEWAAPEIEEAFDNNLIPEVMLDFDLTKKVNRGEFAAIAVQLYETLSKRSVGESKNCTFVDIQYDDNEKAIKKAYQIEVAQGTSTTTYEPLSFINREQLATMLCRVIKKYSYPNWTMENDADYYMDTTGVQKFADDVDISEWAKPSVYFMAKFGIVKGVSDTHFAPKNTTSQQEVSGYASATREQAIILAQRIFSQSDMFGN